MNHIKLKLILTSVILAFGFLFLSHTNTSATTFFNDNFESQNFTNWNTIVNPNVWSIQNINGSYRFGTTNSGVEAEADAGEFSWTDYEFDVDILPISGTDRNLIFRVTNQRTFPFNLNLPVAYGLHMYTNHIWLQKFTVSGIEEPVNLDINLPDQTTTKIRVRVMGPNIKVYLRNDINPIIDWTDISNPILTGKIGLLITGNSQVWFDNIQVTDLVSPTPTLSPTPTPSPTPISLPSLNLNVPDIKQYSLPWGPHTYDHANSWSSVPTITRWGCALTSADMLLQYYGYSITPDSLNNWLNQQADGYIANGLLNWLAVSRYTKQNSTTQPSLEFIKKGNNTQDLVNEIQNNRPAILEEPGHFVVAKSQTQSSFGINDPAYSNHPTLDSYNNTFNSLETYIPSHTNLSYIMLTVTKGFDLHVFDTDNGEIFESTFDSNPLIDDVNNSSKSGDTLTTFLFPKPVDGNYKVNISGNGVYELDSYLYDINGNVNLNKINGVVNKDTDEYNVTIGQTDSTSEDITIDTLIKDWNDANSNSLLKTNGVYKEILIILNTINKFIQNHQNKLAKIALNGLSLLIKFYTPKFIDPSVAKTITSEIQILVNSL